LELPGLKPYSEMKPWDGGVRLAITLINVVFSDPLGPSMTGYGVLLERSV
jgi:hypothetical protein